MGMEVHLDLSMSQPIGGDLGIPTLSVHPLCPWSLTVGHPSLEGREGKETPASLPRVPTDFHTSTDTVHKLTLHKFGAWKKGNKPNKTCLVQQLEICKQPSPPSDFLSLTPTFCIKEIQTRLPLMR